MPIDLKTTLENKYTQDIKPGILNANTDAVLKQAINNFISWTKEVQIAGLDSTHPLDSYWNEGRDLIKKMIDSAIKKAEIRCREEHEICKEIDTIFEWEKIKAQLGFESILTLEKIMSKLIKLKLNFDSKMKGWIENDELTADCHIRVKDLMLEFREFNPQGNPVLEGVKSLEYVSVFIPPELRSAPPGIDIIALIDGLYGTPTLIFHFKVTLVLENKLLNEIIIELNFNKNITGIPMLFNLFHRQDMIGDIITFKNCEIIRQELFARKIIKRRNVGISHSLASNSEELKIELFHVIE